MMIPLGTMLLELEVPGLHSGLELKVQTMITMTGSCFLHVCDVLSKHRLVSSRFPVIFIMSRSERAEGASAVITLR